MATTTPNQETVVQISRQDPAIEAYRLGLLGDVQKFIKDQIGQGVPPELAYQIAGLTGAEQSAVAAAQTGIGAYQPFLQAGEAAIQGGQNILTGAAMPALRQAETTTGASQNLINQAAMLSAAQRAVPYTYQQAAAQTAAGIGAFNPFEEQVVQQSMADIARQAGLQQQGIRAQARGAGAFGGSRQAVAEQELMRNAMEQLTRSAANGLRCIDGPSLTRSSVDEQLRASIWSVRSGGCSSAWRTRSKPNGVGSGPWLVGRSIRSVWNHHGSTGRSTSGYWGNRAKYPSEPNCCRASSGQHSTRCRSSRS